MLGNKRGAFRKGTGDMTWTTGEEDICVLHISIVLTCLSTGSFQLWQGTEGKVNKNSTYPCVHKTVTATKCCFCVIQRRNPTAEVHPWKPCHQLAFSAGTLLPGWSSGFTFSFFCLGQRGIYQSVIMLASAVAVCSECICNAVCHVRKSLMQIL